MWILGDKAEAFRREVWRENARFLIPMRPRWVIAQDISFWPTRPAPSAIPASIHGFDFSMYAISGLSERDWRYCNSTRSEPITTAPARQIAIACSALISLLSSAFTVIAIFSLSFSIVFILI
jgi:hypothetical protein